MSICTKNCEQGKCKGCGEYICVEPHSRGDGLCLNCLIKSIPPPPKDSLEEIDVWLNELRDEVKTFCPYCGIKPQKLKDFIRQEKEKSYQEGRAEGRREVREKLKEIVEKSERKEKWGVVEMTFTEKSGIEIVAALLKELE